MALHARADSGNEWKSRNAIVSRHPIGTAAVQLRCRCCHCTLMADSSAATASAGGPTSRQGQGERRGGRRAEGKEAAARARATAEIRGNEGCDASKER